MKVTKPAPDSPCAENNWIDSKASQSLQFLKLKKIQQESDELLDLIGSCEPKEQPALVHSYNFLDLTASLTACQSCSLRRSCKLPVPLEEPTSFGRDFTVMGLGEAPGSDEDDQCKPFVGKSGKILRNTCNKAGLIINSFTNTCLCRPPSNRTPKEAEVQACRKNLIAQIEFLNPWLIICFGSTPLKALRPDFQITKDHGYLFPASFPELKRQIWAVGVYHPSYVLRKSGDDAESLAIRRSFVEDIQFLAAICEAHRILGAEMIHPLMKEARTYAPYIPGQPAKTELARKLYLQRLEEQNESGEQSYGIPEPEHMSSGSDTQERGQEVGDLPF